MGASRQVLRMLLLNKFFFCPWLGKRNQVKAITRSKVLFFALRITCDLLWVHEVDSFQFHSFLESMLGYEATKQVNRCSF